MAPHGASKRSTSKASASLSKSPDKPVPPPELLDIKLDPYGQEWENQYKAVDPIFMSVSTVKEFEKVLGRPIQPYQHVLDEVTPLVADKFGLERHIPTKELVKTSRGVKCRANDKRL